MIRWLLCAAVIVLSVWPLAGQVERLPGQVQAATARWATNEFGDQRIVTDLAVEANGRTYDVTVEGGEVDGIGMASSTSEVPAPGAAVDLVWDRGHRRYRIAEGDGDYSFTGRKWFVPSMTYVVDVLYSELTPEVTIRDLQDAASSWTLQGGIPFTMNYGGRIADGSGVHAWDQTNVMLFRPTLNPDASSAIATSYWFYDTATNELLDSDIIGWSGKVAWFAQDAVCSGSAGAFTLDVFTHEFGHTIGLGHSSVSGATMWPSYSYCSTTFRSLSTDDIAGAQALYGTGTPPPPPPPPGPTCTLNNVTYQPGEQTSFRLRASKVSGWLGAHPEWQFISSTPLPNPNYVWVTVECQPTQGSVAWS